MESSRSLSSGQPIGRTRWLSITEECASRGNSGHHAVTIEPLGLAVRIFRFALGLFPRLSPFLGEFFRLALRLLLFLRLQPCAFGAGFGALLLALLLAGLAFAADRLEIGFEVVGAVVVID